MGTAVAPSSEATDLEAAQESGGWYVERMEKPEEPPEANLPEAAFDAGDLDDCQPGGLASVHPSVGLTCRPNKVDGC